MRDHFRRYTRKEFDDTIKTISVEGYVGHWEENEVKGKPTYKSRTAKMVRSNWSRTLGPFSAPSNTSFTWTDTLRKVGKLSKVKETPFQRSSTVSVIWQQKSERTSTQKQRIAERNIVQEEQQAHPSFSSSSWWDGWRASSWWDRSLQWKE